MKFEYMDLRINKACMLYLLIRSIISRTRIYIFIYIYIYIYMYLSINKLINDITHDI